VSTPLLLSSLAFVAGGLLIAYPVVRRRPALAARLERAGAPVRSRARLGERLTVDARIGREAQALGARYERSLRQAGEGKNVVRLIELTFKAGGAEIEVSVTAEEFRAHQPTHPDRHLIKVHGTISRPETIVLTRDDYAASRKNRTEMFDHLAHEVHYSSRRPRRACGRRSSPSRCRRARGSSHRRGALGCTPPSP
jgi:SIR2-like domain